MSKENKAKETKKPKYRKGPLWNLDLEPHARKATAKLQKKMPGLSRTAAIEQAVIYLDKWLDEHPEEANKIRDEHLLARAQKRLKAKTPER